MPAGTAAVPLPHTAEESAKATGKLWAIHPDTQSDSDKRSERGDAKQGVGNRAALSAGNRVLPTAQRPGGTGREYTGRESGLYRLFA